MRVPPIAVRVLPNGSRVSCGRLARRRKMKWTTVRARQGTTLITACQLQALVGRRFRTRALGAFVMGGADSRIRHSPCRIRLATGRPPRDARSN